jgi:hypothetical protein
MTQCDHYNAITIRLFVSLLLATRGAAKLLTAIPPHRVIFK